MKLSLPAIIIPLLVSVGMAAPVQVVCFSLSSKLTSSSAQWGVDGNRVAQLTWITGQTS